MFVLEAQRNRNSANNCTEFSTRTRENSTSSFWRSSPSTSSRKAPSKCTADSCGRRSRSWNKWNWSSTPSSGITWTRRALCMRRAPWRPPKLLLSGNRPPPSSSRSELCCDVWEIFCMWIFSLHSSLLSFSFGFVLLSFFVLLFFKLFSLKRTFSLCCIID